MAPSPARCLSLLLLPALLAACGERDAPGDAGDADRVPVAAGALESPAIVEASGLAVSRRDPSALWVVNDGGEAPVLHRLRGAGTAAGQSRVEGAENRDWEDLASFRLDGEPWLLIADIGDNGGVRDYLTLYVVPEPLAEEPVRPAWSIRFTYPDGPHDAESVAVDAGAGRVFVLTKRTEPAQLHELPLRPPPDGRVLTTTPLGPVTSLPGRNEASRAGFAAMIPYHWQPTGMDIAADGSAIVILTYADVYYYPRAAGEAWFEVLAKAPRALGMPLTPVAEGVAFDETGRIVYVTAEGRHAPLLRFELR